MKRKLGIFLAVLCLLSSTMVSAAELQPLITEAGFYTGSLYYCDAETGVVVLREIAVVGIANEKNAKTASDAEYVEIPVVGPVLFTDKSEISLSDCNYYPDNKVRALITRDSTGALRILQLRFT